MVQDEYDDYYELKFFSIKITKDWERQKKKINKRRHRRDDNTVP